MFIRSRALLLAVALLLQTASATELVRIATYNIEDLGSFGSAQSNALASVLNRVHADIVLVQELDDAEGGPFGTFGSANGYPYSRFAGTSGTLTGGLMNGVLSKYPILSHVSWNATSISGDPSANDITRNVLQVTISIPNVCEPVTVFSLHLKAGSTQTDDFRRAVELMRVKQVVEDYLALNPSHHVFIGGDLNDDVGDGPFGATFNSLPSGLPQTYKLGNDVSFPVVYDPFVLLSSIGGIGMQPVFATHEDSTTVDATRTSGRRLDYIYVRKLTATKGDEVYYSPADNGVDDGPSGNWLYKNGVPLPSGTTGAASDHYTPYCDYLMEGCDGLRYGFGSAGDHLLIPSAGIRGGAGIGDSSFGLRAFAAKPNAPATLILGQAKLSPPFGFSLAPWVPGGSLHVSPAGLFGLFNVLADGTGRATFPLPLPSDSNLIGLSLNSQWFVADPGAPNGVGAMSDAYEVIVQP